MKKLTVEEEIGIIEGEMSPRRRRFVGLFILTYDAKGSLESAGYKGIKYMGAKAHSMLRDERIARLIELRLKQVEDETRLSVSSTLKLIEEAMHVDPADYLDEAGRPLALSEIPVNVRKSIQSMIVTERKDKMGVIYAVEHTYRFIEKTRMIELLATIQRLKKDEADDLADNFVSKLQAAGKRVENAKDPAKEPMPDNVHEMPRKTGADASTTAKTESKPGTKPRSDVIPGNDVIPDENMEMF